MTKVLKRDKKKQAFSAAKLKRSIEKAAKEAGIVIAKRKKLVREIAEPVTALAKKKSVIKAIAIRKMIFRRLETRAKSVINAWRKYERKKKK